MIRVNQLKLPITHDEAAIAKKVGRLLKLRPEKISSIKIVKQSLDARKKEELLYIYSVDVKSEINEEA
ncbi:MAG: FAD-dependent oxidoreductase, partial [Clostridium sp.]